MCLNIYVRNDPYYLLKYQIPHHFFFLFWSIFLNKKKALTFFNVRFYMPFRG